MTHINNDDLISAQIELNELLSLARKKESHMSAGSRRAGPVSRALEDLGKTRISFGSPRDNLIRLTPRLFKTVGVALEPFQREKLKTENFYYLTIAISMVPGDAVNYDQIKCELEFESDVDHVPIIHSMFPTAEWKEILRWGAELSLGLNADFTWRLGLDLDNPDIHTSVLNLPADAKLMAKNINEAKGFIVIPRFSYSLGRAEIAATGVGNTFGYWDIQKPELKQVQTVKLSIIFKVPKEIKQVSLTGKVVATTSKNWLFANLKPLLNSLTESQQALVERGVPLGDYAEWKLKLT